MNSDKSRNLEIPLSTGQINDAFTSLLLMTGHLHEGEVITNVVIPQGILTDVKSVLFQIQKEEQASRPV